MYTLPPMILLFFNPSYQFLTIIGLLKNNMMTEQDWLRRVSGRCAPSTLFEQQINGKSTNY